MAQGGGGVSDYAQFLARKAIIDPATGLAEIPTLNPMLFDFQHDIVNWALRRGRAAIFADCGLGKTPMQLEWARHVPGDVLILAPLAVSAQTVREGEKFGVRGHRKRRLYRLANAAKVFRCRTQAQLLGTRPPKPATSTD